MIECGCSEICWLDGWTDQFQPTTREVLVFTKSTKRYFDLNAVREPHQASTDERSKYGRKVGASLVANPRRGDYMQKIGELTSPLNPIGAPPLDWWNLPWDAVRDRLVRAMVPERVCKTCGEPQRRITKTKYVEVPNRPLRDDDARRYGSIDGKRHNDHRATQPITLGWTDCGHNDWRPGVVLDPFLKPGEPMTATMYIGDVLDVLGKLPEKSVDLVLTSPPFLALRSYLPSDHPLKEKEGGSQSTPGGYIDWLLDVVEACDRVLAPHGSLCFELGDTYAGSGEGGGDFIPGSGQFSNPARLAKATQANGPGRKGTGWPLPKSLSLIPESFRFAMVYGFNPFTGRQTERWRLRNVIRWVRPNPPVGALGDKFRPATSELMVFCKSAKRYFDLDAVREPHKSDPTKFTGNGYGKRQPEGLGVGTISEPGNPIGAPPLDWWNIPLLEGEEETRYGPKPPKDRIDEVSKVGKKAKAREGQGGDWSRGSEGLVFRNPNGAPPLDWWNIPPGGYSGAHYAVWPPELLIKPIKAMCPEQVCRKCGEPSRRLLEKSPEYAEFRAARTFREVMPKASAQQHARNESYGVTTSLDQHNDKGARTGDLYRTVGFTDCGHNDYRPGLVLDPFVGSGTTLAVATGHGRDAIGVDLDERNFTLALERVGPLVLQRGEVAA